MPARLRAAAAAEHGFAMVAVLAVMLVASIVAVAAVDATNNDRVVSSRDRDKKRAYAAAEAGVNDYLARLVSNVDYWRKCGSDPANPALNPRWNGTGADPRGWATVPGSTARYAVEVLPANGQSACLASDPVGTFVDTNTGTFRIRSTGQVNGENRTVVATFKRRGFLDYVYFTYYETNSPESYIRDVAGLPTRLNPPSDAVAGPDIVTWAKSATGCGVFRRDGRASRGYQGYYQSSSGWQAMTSPVRCGEIQFITGDNQNGPFHTNDEILVCGTPVFGRSPTDDIEVSAPPVDGSGTGSQSGWRACGGGGSPQVNDPAATTPNPAQGTWRKSSPTVDMPPSNQALDSVAGQNYRFVGRVDVQMTGTDMKFTSAAKRQDGTTVPAGTTIPLPKDGVVYVANDPSSSCPGYQILTGTTSTPNGGCGDLNIRGTYKFSVTFAAQNDIVVTGDVTHADSDDVLLGLIATQWVRVAHPVTGASLSNNYGSCTNAASTPTNVTIDAAILALQNSFTVDYYWCGASLGNLTVDGAIAQRFRGPVGTGGGGAGTTGYIKKYTYDDRFRFRSPPRFLDPVKASWKIQTQTEQVPAS